MEKSYINVKKQKKKSTIKFVWLLIAFAIIFIIIVARFALSGDGDDVFSGAPSSGDVYKIAQAFVIPTIKSPSPTFSDSEYQFGQKPDSVYIIKSYVDTKDNSGGDQKINFEITLKFKGGSKSNQQNWDVLNLNEY